MDEGYEGTYSPQAIDLAYAYEHRQMDYLVDLVRDAAYASALDALRALLRTGPLPRHQASTLKNLAAQIVEAPDDPEYGPL